MSPVILMHDLVWLGKPKSDVGKSNLLTDWKIKGKDVYPASDDFPTVCEVMEWLLSEVSEIFISNLAQFVKFMIFHSCENSKKLTSKSIKIGTSKKKSLR